MENIDMRIVAVYNYHIFTKIKAQGGSIWRKKRWGEAVGQAFQGNIQGAPAEQQMKLSDAYSVKCDKIAVEQSLCEMKQKSCEKLVNIAWREHKFGVLLKKEQTFISLEEKKWR